MNVLVLNSGSSSIKFCIYDDETETEKIKGKVSESNNELYVVIDNICKKKVSSFEVAKKFLFFFLKEQNVDCIIHRVVHGGSKYHDCTKVDSKVKNDIEAYSDLAPLHNPNALEIIRLFEGFGVESYVTFDTSFHMTIPEENWRYSLPSSIADKYDIRKYGFHGISYQYILEELLKEETNINAIICHMGGGSSICNIKDSRSYDITMGMTPIGGIMMPSRIDELDPMVIPYLLKKTNLSYDEIVNLLNRESGYQGICNTADEKAVCDLSEKGNEEAILARNRANNLFKKVIGGYIFENPSVDKIVLTGGMGAKNYRQRELFLSNLDMFGIKLDTDRNKANYNERGIISTDDSNIPIMIIPTDEEKMMLRLYKRIRS